MERGLNCDGGQAAQFSVLPETGIWSTRKLGWKQYEICTHAHYLYLPQPIILSSSIPFSSLIYDSRTALVPHEIPAVSYLSLCRNQGPLSPTGSYAGLVFLETGRPLYPTEYNTLSRLASLAVLENYIRLGTTFQAPFVLASLPVTKCSLDKLFVFAYKRIV